MPLGAARGPVQAAGLEFVQAGPYGLDCLQAV